VSSFHDERRRRLLSGLSDSELRQELDSAGEELLRLERQLAHDKVLDRVNARATRENYAPLGKISTRMARTRARFSECRARRNEAEAELRRRAYARRDEWLEETLRD
jgi:hypothetical protein